MKNNPTILVYDNSSEDYIVTEAWSGIKSFLSYEIEACITSNRYAMIEIVNEGTHGDNSKYYRGIESLNSFLQKYLSTINNRYKILFSIDRATLKSRIRSYKKIFDKSIPSIEVEFDVEQAYSIKAGIVLIDD